MDRHIPLNVARAVIIGDVQALRFEEFANGLISAIEGGRPILSTSITYDRGRDGKTVGPGPQILVCSSLNDAPDEKAQSDVQKIVDSQIRVERIYFCSSQHLTEYAKDKISATLRTKLTESSSIEVLGAYDLAYFSMRFPEIAWKFYSTELLDVLRALDSGKDEDDASRFALELALCTIGHDDSVAIRRSAYRSSLRTVLSDGIPRSLAECARDVSAKLKLGRNLPESVIRLYLDELKNDQEVSFQDERYLITTKGSKAAEDAQGGAAEALMKGRREIRSQIEREIGFSLEDGQFAVMWRTIQDKLALLFYSRGREMVDCVAALLGQKELGRSKLPESDAEFVPFFAGEVATAVEEACSSKELGGRVRVAISDIFSEGIGPAFEWLVEVCAGFVTICSLGLEASTGERIRHAIARIALVFDTDVLLSYLGQGEPDHTAVVELTKRWRELGGRILQADPVLKEASYHAWIAERDFSEVNHWLPGTELDRIRFIKNVFVRSFANILSKNKKLKKGQWRTYIDQFRGKNEYDSSVLMKYVSTETKSGLLPRILGHDSGWEKDVQAYCMSEAERMATTTSGERERKIGLDKANRDAELYVSLVHYVDSLQDSENEGNCYLVSSAHRLAELEKRFHPGELPRILSIGAVLHMLALVPGVSVGLTALGTLLFDGSFRRGMSDLGMVLRRVLRDSEGFTMPWAGRVALERDMRSRIVARAAEAGGTPAEQQQRAKELEREIVNAGRPEAAAVLIREALEQTGADSRLERQLAEANRKIAELEAQVRQRRKKGGTLPK